MTYKDSQAAFLEWLANWLKPSDSTYFLVGAYMLSQKPTSEEDFQNYFQHQYL